MKRWKIMIMALLTAVTVMVGPAAPDAGAAEACGEGSPTAPVCVDELGSTPECRVCSAGPCEFIFLLNKAITQSLDVSYAVRDRTALWGVHYTGLRSGRVTIPAGATVGSATVQVLTPEPGALERVFDVMLTSVSVGTIGNDRVEMHIPAGR